MEVTRPALRYYGSKFRLAPWIIAHFPAHMAYVEPYGGAMSVLLRKVPSKYEVYNDLDGEVVNFFRVLREQPDALIRAIELTPFAREEQRVAFELEGDELERARRLYVRCWQSHGGGRTQWRTGWRYDLSAARHKSVVKTWNETEYLWAIVNRLKLVQIEHAPALHVIECMDRPDTLFYCDPPYLPETRSERWREHAYACEMDERGHRELAQALHQVAGMALISGYPCALYDELYGDWRRVEKPSRTDFGQMAMECLWISPKADQRLRQLSMGI